MSSFEQEFRPDAREIQLTFAPFGHCLNSTQCFSPDGKQLVYDTRNDDAALAANGQIRVVNIATGEDLLVYETKNQSFFGPGVGAATWSPDGRYWLFLGGIQNADKTRPYSFTRRTGIAVSCLAPGEAIWMDARHVEPPYTAGALRGGTHAHTWSGQDGWISCTYNDAVMEAAARLDSSVADLRTVAVLLPRTVHVPEADGVENKSGQMYAVIIAPVLNTPTPGSDEISKAFDECWIGENGYIANDGTRIRKAIAYQGHARDGQGQLKTEIFIADLPDQSASLVGDVGSDRSLPRVPDAIQNRRISFLKDGVSPTPRHWLRSTADGSLIGFYAVDENDMVQLWGISPNGGQARQLSQLPVSADGPFNFSPDGAYAACPAGNRIWLVRLSDGATAAVTSEQYPSPLNGAVIWSPNGNKLAYNRIVNGWMQIFLTELDGLL